MLQSEPLSAVSLFSGAGGMDQGFKEAGIRPLFANDLDPDACDTYRLNHGDKIVRGDLQGFLPELAQYRGVDFVFGGPPCQGFSVAGKMDPNDVRSQLIKRFFDVVLMCRPRAFVCENVKALATLQKFANIRSEIERSARHQYSMATLVLRASDFGVPQHRDRMFIVGISRDILDCNTETFSGMLTGELAQSKQSPQTISDVIRGLGRAGSAGNSRVCKARITFAANPVMRVSPYAGMLFNGAGRPLDPDGQSSTLPASMGGNKTPIVDEGAIFDGKTPFVETYHRALRKGGKAKSGLAPADLRRLTVDECLAIQTFPPNYKMAGSTSALFRQIGNAVPARLAAAVAKSVSAILADANKSRVAVAAE
mgnify:CR=1 FL=1